MRMSGVVIGGLLGAMAAMYFNRAGSLRLSNLGNAGQALDRLVDSARSRMMEPDNRSYYGGSASQSTAGGGDLGQVEQIVKEDPQLSREVNTILSENKDTATIR